MASASKSASHDPASRSPFPAASWVVLAVAALLIVPTGWFVVSLTVQPSDGSLVQHASSVSQASGVLVDEVIEEGDGLRVGKLNLSLYGTRDAAMNWAKKFTDVLVGAGFVKGT